MDIVCSTSSSSNEAVYRELLSVKVEIQQWCLNNKIQTTECDFISIVLHLFSTSLFIEGIKIAQNTIQANLLFLIILANDSLNIEQMFCSQNKEMTRKQTKTLLAKARRTCRRSLINTYVMVLSCGRLQLRFITLYTDKKKSLTIYICKW